MRDPLIKFFFFLIVLTVIFIMLSWLSMAYPYSGSWVDEYRFVEQWRQKYAEFGIASWYGKFHHGMEMASGYPFDMNNPTIVAHKTLPLGTVIQVTNLRNGKEIRLMVRDRGPYIRGRIVDLSYAAAKEIGMVNDGIVPCKVEVI